MVINQRGSTFIYKQHSSRCSNTHEVNNNSHTHTHNSNYKWQRYITLITYLLTYNSRDAAHISGPQPHPHASTYTHTHTNIFLQELNNWPGFHAYFHYPYWQHRLISYNSWTSKFVWMWEELPVHLLWSLLARRDLSINISNVRIQHSPWCRAKQLWKHII